MMSANIRSTAIAVVTALLLAAALVPAVSAADCNDGILSCDLTGAEQTEAQQVSISATSTIVPLIRDAEDPSVYSRAFSLYFSLLDGASLPQDGGLAVGLDERVVADVTGAEVRETSVAIRLNVDGEDGWKVISRRVSSGAADQQATGIPAADGDSFFSTFDFTTGDDAEDAVLDAFTTRSQPTFGITDTTTWRITEAARPVVPVADLAGSDPVAQDGVTQLTPPSPGEVAYAVTDLTAFEGLFGPTAGLGDLIALEGTAPGRSWSTDALLVTQADDVNDDTGPLPVAVPPLPTDVLNDVPTSLAVGYGDLQTGEMSYLNNENTIVQGSQLWQTNAHTQQHPIICADATGKFLPKQCNTNGFNNAGDLLPVAGTEALEPGTYYYVCRVHGGNPTAQTDMWGTFTVVG